MENQNIFVDEWGVRQQIRSTLRDKKMTVTPIHLYSLMMVSIVYF